MSLEFVSDFVIMEPRREPFVPRIHFLAALLT